MRFQPTFGLSHTLLSSLCVFVLSACGGDADVASAAAPTQRPAEVSTPTQGAPAAPVVEVLKPNQDRYRDVGFTLPACYTPGVPTGNDADTHACSWVYQAGRLQVLLSRSLPITQSTFPATHNSFNSTAYPGLSSSGDPNHSLTLGQQLALGMEGLELDLHWLPHLSSGGLAPVVCHGLGANMGHFGCTPQDRHVREVLTELAAALARPENKDRVLMLDLEDNLADYRPPNGAQASVTAHDQAAALFEETLGPLVYKPAQPQPGTPEACTSLPIQTLSKQDVLDAGKRVILVGGCGVGVQWKKWVFALDRQQKANDGFDASTCEADFFKPADYSKRFTRLWHDSTQLGRFTNSSLKAITAEDVREMNRCGLHQASLDRLVIGDERLQANVWSWEPGQPTVSGGQQCAYQQGSGRWQAGDCEVRRAYACRKSSVTTGTPWIVVAGADRHKGRWEAGRNACEAEGADFDLPRSSGENRALQAALEKSGLQTVWLNWSANQGRWPLPPKP